MYFYEFDGAICFVLCGCGRASYLSDVIAVRQLISKFTTPFVIDFNTLILIVDWCVWHI